MTKTSPDIMMAVRDMLSVTIQILDIDIRRSASSRYMDREAKEPV